MTTTIDVATPAVAQAHVQRLHEQAAELRLHGLPPESDYLSLSQPTPKRNS